MDAITVDVTQVPGVQLWDEAVLLGRQGEAEIDIHEIARLKQSVSYDAMVSWRGRLPRRYLE
jgi:alanine racemase